MQIRTVKDLGAIIRDQRKKQGLDQADLAARVGVSRQWIIEVEKGKPRAEVSLILKTLDALGLNVLIEADDHSSISGSFNIDTVVQSAKEKKR